MPGQWKGPPRRLRGTVGEEGAREKDKDSTTGAHCVVQRHPETLAARNRPNSSSHAGETTGNSAEPTSARPQRAGRVTRRVRIGTSFPCAALYPGAEGCVRLLIQQHHMTA